MYTLTKIRPAATTESAIRHRYPDVASLLTSFLLFPRKTCLLSVDACLPHPSIGRLASIGLPTAMVGGSVVYDRSVFIE